MCTVSDKLKLCTCATKNVEQLKHYWKLWRNNGKKFIAMGEPVLPALFDEAVDQLNTATILQALNSGQCFDVELQHRENDILELSFTLNKKTMPAAVPGESNQLCYTFRFSNGNWLEEVHDPFELIDDNYRMVQKGAIKKPFG